MPGMFEGEPLSGSTANDVGIRMTWNAPDRGLDNVDGIYDRPPGGDYRIDWSDDGVKWQLGQSGYPSHRGVEASPPCGRASYDITAFSPRTATTSA